MKIWHFVVGGVVLGGGWWLWKKDSALGGVPGVPSSVTNPLQTVYDPAFAGVVGRPPARMPPVGAPPDADKYVSPPVTSTGWKAPPGPKVVGAPPQGAPPNADTPKPATVLAPGLAGSPRRW